MIISNWVSFVTASKARLAERSSTIIRVVVSCFSQPLRTSVIPPASLPTLAPARAPSLSSTTQEILVLARPRENPAPRANQTPPQEGKKSQAKFFTVSLLSSFRLEPGVVWNNLPKQNLTLTCSPEATSSIFDRGRSKKLSIKSPSTKPIVGSIFLSLEKERQVEKQVKALLNFAVMLITVNFSLVPARKTLQSLAQSSSDRCRQNHLLFFTLSYKTPIKHF